MQLRNGFLATAAMAALVLLVGCGASHAALTHTSKSSSTAPSPTTNVTAKPSAASSTETVATGVPTLSLGPMTSTPVVTSFTGTCSASGFPASGGSATFSATVGSGSTGFTEATDFWIGYTPTNFYYCAQISTKQILATATGAGASTWTADDMEFWLAPTNSRAEVRGTNTYQLLFNPAGGWNNAQGTGVSGQFNFNWKSNVVFKVVVHGTLNGAVGSATGWAVLAALPWTSVGLSTAPKAGQVMGFNTGGCINTGCTQTTDWVPGVNLNNWHTPALWGEITVR